MTKVMFLTLMALSFLGVADTVQILQAQAARAATREGGGVPNLDVQSGCKDMANNQLNKTTNYDGCLRDERTAREQLQKEWASYPADSHSQCIHLVTPPALPSYVTLQECLKLARDARNMTKDSSGAEQIGKTMQTPGQ